MTTNIEITANAAKAIKELRRTGEEFDKLGDKAEESGDKTESSFAKVVNIMGGPVKAAAIAAGAAVAGLAVATLKLADRGELVGSVAEGFERLGGQAATIDDAAKRTLGLVNSFELMELANKGLVAGLPDINKNFGDIAEAGARLANTLGKDTKATIEQLTQAIATGRQQQLQQLGVMVDARAEVAKYAAANKIAVADVDELTKKQILQKAALEEVRNVNKTVADVTLSVSNANIVFKNKLRDSIDQVAIAINSNETLQKAIQIVGEALLKLVNFIGSAVIKSLDFLDREVKKVTTGFAVAAKVAQQIKDGEFYGLSLATQEVAIDMKAAAVEAAKLAKAQAAAGESARASMKYEEDFSASLDKTGESAKKAAKEIEIYQSQVALGPGGDPSQASFIDDFFAGFGPELGGALKGVGESFIGSAFDALLSGGSFDQSLTELGGGIGGALGEAAGIPFAGQLGASIGQSLGLIGESTESTGKAIGDLFGKAFALPTGGLSLALGDSLGDAIAHAFGGNTNAEANARDGFIDFMNNAIDGANLQFLIDDKLQELDFNISGGRKAFNDGGLFATAFEGLEDSAVAAFTGVGNAFNQLLDTGEDIGAQLGAIFADNLGGDLNNLQLLLQSSGVSAEQMGDSLREAFLEGNLTAIETLDGLRAVEDIMKKGIPGATGAIDKAFDNLVKGAGTGRQAADAVVDVFAEAKEIGIDSLGALEQRLIDLGTPAQQVEQFMEAIAETGIRSIDEGLNQSLDQTIQIFADLESQNFEFLGGIDDGIAKVEKVISKLDDIPNEITKRVNFDVRVTGDDIPAGIVDTPGLN